MFVHPYRLVSISSYFKPFLPDSIDLARFATWAFGASYPSMRANELMAAWNRRHGEWFIVNGEDGIEETAERMVGVWKCKDALYPRCTESLSKERDRELPDIRNLHLWS